MSSLRININTKTRYYCILVKNNSILLLDFYSFGFVVILGS